MNKTYLVIISILVLIGFWAFFATNSSYQEALQARFYYEVGNYKKANELAKNAYEKDAYNKMAYTILNQSQIALKYEKFINQANEYLDKISAISKTQNIQKQDISRIKLMCEIVIKDYESLKSSRLTPNSIQNEARDMRDKFLQLQKELFGDEKG